MKTLAVAFSAALLAGLVAAGATTFVLGARQEAARVAAERPAGPSGPAIFGRDAAEPLDPTPALRTRVEDLETQLAAVQAQLALALDARTAVEPRAAPAAAAAVLPSDPVEARALVQEVLAQEREEQAAERAVRAEEYAVQRARLAAAAIAKELGLAPADEEQVAQVLTLDSQKRRALRDELFGDMRDGGFDPELLMERGEQMRARNGEIEAWKRQELSSRLGDEVAGKVLEAEDSRRVGRARGLGQFLGRGRER